MSERDFAAVRAAHLYYMQNMTMAAIAAELGVSRSSVSRLLSYARESGLVDITIRAPGDRSSDLANELARRYDVAFAVAPTTSRLSQIDRLERVGVAGGQLVSQAMESGMTLGVAWGATISAVSRHIMAKPLWNARVVQLNGAGNQSTSGIDYASEILQRFGQAFDAQIEQFPVPAFFDEAATKVALWRERSTRRVLDVQRHMDIAIFGLGSPWSEVPGHVYATGYLDPADVASLQADGVVGDVATVFYRRDGSTSGIELNARASGPDLDVIRSAARRIAVVSGQSKADATQGALNAGLVTDVVLDEGLARVLVER